MMKEVAPAPLCHEAVAAQGLLGRCCWKIWDSRLPPCPNHHFLFSLIVIWNFMQPHDKLLMISRFNC